MNESLSRMLRELRLGGMAETLEVRLQEARASGLTHQEFLELVLADETLVRNDRKIDRGVRRASFRDVRRLEDFDFSFNRSIDRAKVFELASGHFLRSAKDVLLCGPPGTGKSHLAQAVGHAVIRSGAIVYYRSIFDVVRDFLHDEAMGGEEKVLARYLKPDLLIIDDMGMKQLPKRSGEYLFEIIMRRHEVRSTIMTTNRPLEDWGKLIGDVPSASAILDRFLQSAEIMKITGRSYRLKNSGKKSKGAKAPPGSAAEEKE
ncbi:DNA replication protein DnaC [Novipirellula aureliae]|uniref:DNA replication protein DnaC n=1 Tax=Novipirellula aureliae TaxID=2527966 RepID=A0A5C6DIW6_9BACT|nr:IS21-like element helper ATPase IstB [Novipirellula aureliae]TWU36522.1 DNA replication protein DnaC [Novipirellula aureliae]